MVMGRKSSGKNRPHGAAPSEQGPTKSGVSPVLLAAVVVLLLAGGAFVFMRGGGTPTDPASTPAANAAKPGEPQTAKAAEPTPEIVAATAATAALGPHKQATFPPIPYAGYPPPRPVDVVDAAFRFAGEHPEILSYVPCFCGCQHSGHKGNTDCFVRSRAANGDVIEWEPHGIECAVCIDVATRARQMHASGASVRDIRAAVEKEFGPKFPTMTPTPKPPSTSAHNRTH
jgi:Protein of unknown function with PCYCGC motif